MNFTFFPSKVSKRNLKMKNYHHLDATNLRFSIFSSKNLKALSVAKIVTPLVFDQLGHPLPGGLYDQKMGEYEARNRRSSLGRIE